MIALLYIIICILTGSVLCRAIFELTGKDCDFFGLADGTLHTYTGRDTGVSNLFFVAPVTYVTGTILVTWLVYILSCAEAGTRGALGRGITLGMIITVAADVAGIILLKKHSRKEVPSIWPEFPRIPEFISICAVIGLFSVLMIRSLYLSGETLSVGLSVFSDFTPHISMIRSFTYGDNFPTAYSVCAGEDIRYHFMFEFYSAVLERGGLNLDQAFNVPSILSIVSMYSLLFSLAVRITGSRLAGLITMLLQTFRSSFSFFLFLADKPADTTLPAYLRSNTEFLGYTPNEDWGLWNLNVYCNQRHLALGLCVILILIWLFLPLLYARFDRLSGERRVKELVRSSLFEATGWTMRAPVMAIAAGILLGACSFWNGACVIACLIVLFFMAIVSDNRMDLVLTAGMTLLLTLLQSSVFVDGSVVSTSYRYGFLAENPTFWGSLLYIIKLMGILPILLLIIFFLAKARERYLIFAFSMPIVFAFTVSLTPDIAVNHKYIMISILLLNIFVGSGIAFLFEKKNVKCIFIAVFLTLTLTVSGIYDTYILLKRNSPETSIDVPARSGITEWIRTNCTADDLFCTSNYYLCCGDGSSVILGGAMLYNAWQYFGWSAGYDTDYRDMVVKAVYGATSKSMLRAVVKNIGFDYIIVDESNRLSEDYELNEDLIAETYAAAYTSGYGQNKFTIYSTK